MYLSYSAVTEMEKALNKYFLSEGVRLAFSTCFLFLGVVPSLTLVLLSV